MTIFEHALVGIDGALAAGLHRRYGWQIVAWSACAAVLPDWDGLTLLLGPRCYAEGHRVWGHNLLTVGLLAVALSTLVWRCDVLTRIWRRLGPRVPAVAADSVAMSSHSPGPLAVWIFVGLLAAYSHLVADLLVSGGHGLSPWGLPLLWPFRHNAWSYPIVPWGDVGPTIILAAGMLVMARRRAWTQPAAGIALALVVGYFVARGALH